MKGVAKAAKAAKATRKVQHKLPGKGGSLMTLLRVARLGRRLVKAQLPVAAETVREASERLAEMTNKFAGSTDGLRDVTEHLRDHGFRELAERARRFPVQLSIDVGVPVEVAYDEWLKLDSLPEGDHRVQDIGREDDRLIGEIAHRGDSQEWEAEVRDERRDESFAWRSVSGSDVAGLVTFHPLGARLTRIELELDIVPLTAGEAVSLALRLSDRMAEAELRRFKWRVESISPDDYPERVKERVKKRVSRRADGAKRPTRKAAGDEQTSQGKRKSSNRNKED